MVKHGEDLLLQTWEDSWIRLSIARSTSMYLLRCSATLSLRITSAFLISAAKNSGLRVLMIYTRLGQHTTQESRGGPQQMKEVLTLKR